MTAAEKERRDMMADYRQRIRAVRDLYGDVFDRKNEIMAEKKRRRAEQQRRYSKTWYEKHKEELRQRRTQEAKQ